jgi:pimeloyl-ACP methyl ester carboxylesterase
VTTRHRVVLLPGAVLPAEPAYAALLETLGERVEAVAKDLEVYAGDQPPPDFGLDTEARGILREADAHGFDRFHLVGYSGGGASSLAFAARHGERLVSLALLEPAWAGNERTAPEEALAERFRALLPLPPDEFMDRRRRGSPSGRQGLAPSSTRSKRATSISRHYARSTGPSTSRSAAAAIPTTSLGWRSGWRRSSRTSRSRRSRSATISTRRTGPSRSA